MDKFLRRVTASIFITASLAAGPAIAETVTGSASDHAMLEGNVGEGKPFSDQMEQLLRVPMAVDANGDGILSGAEVLGAGARLLSLDDNGDGQLDRKEMGAYEPVPPLIRWHRITNVLDRDGDIRLSAEEIANASISLAILDRNHDLRIDKTEMAMRRLGLPVFARPMGLDFDEWVDFRAYTDGNEGPITPDMADKAYDGFMLIHDAGDWSQVQVSNSTYLMGPDGEKVHEWKNPNGYIPEATVAYLLPNGNLLRTLSRHHWINDRSFPVGAHSTIEMLDWDGNILWEYSMSAPTKFSFHHDVEYMPNGNILAIRYTGFTREEAMALGWDPANGEKAKNRIDKEGSGLVWLDTVIELQPNLEDGSTEIVWQWNTWDHLVQETYPNKSNFGDVTDPRKINVNYINLDTDVPFNAGQFHHMNAIDYNPDLDMILVSSPIYGEIWFIDHSTTLAEAASSTGGTYGKGGDLLFRFGNNEAFGLGTRDDSMLFWQHDAHWIEEGLPGAGNILVYNNGTRRTLDDKYMKKPKHGGVMTSSYTNIVEVDVPFDKQTGFGPAGDVDIPWQWEAEARNDFFSPFMSGAQRLPNGNTIFNRAYDKYIVEVTPEGEKVLDFSLPGWGRLHRINKYAPDYSGLNLVKHNR